MVHSELVDQRLCAAFVYDFYDMDECLCFFTYIRTACTAVRSDQRWAVHVPCRLLISDS